MKAVAIHSYRSESRSSVGQWVPAVGLLLALVLFFVALHVFAERVDWSSRAPGLRGLPLAAPSTERSAAGEPIATSSRDIFYMP